jgi:hypothetical protein
VISEVASEQERGARSSEALVAYARRLGPDPTLADVEDEVLAERLRTGAAALAAATCGWLMLLGEFVVRGAWAADGARSPASWLSWALGIGPSTAREHVRVALRLRELPATRERFAAGTLSYSKVRAISRVADRSTEATLLGWADAATAAELERIVRDARAVRRAQTAPAVRHDLGASGRWRDDGTYELKVRVDAATGLEIEQLLDRLFELAVSSPAADDVPGARRSRRQVMGDAVVGALASAVAAGPDDTTGADRHLAVVELSAATFLAASGATGEADVLVDAGAPDAGASAEAERADPTAGRAAMVGSGRGRGRTRPVPLLQLRRLLCGARVDVLVRDREGSPADLGTTRRYPDARLRRLLLARDRTCRFPGCGAVRFLHAHHVVGWADGGATDLDNLILVCGHHHRFVHAAAWVLRPDGVGAWTFHPPADDDASPPHPRAGALAGASAGALHLALAAHADRADPRSLTPRARDGFGYDHDLTVSLLLERLARPPIAA